MVNLTKGGQIDTLPSTRRRYCHKRISLSRQLNIFCVEKSIVLYDTILSNDINNFSEINNNKFSEININNNK